MKKKNTLCLTTIIVLAFLLRFNNLSERSFDLDDEGTYANQASSGFVFMKFVYNNFSRIISKEINKEEFRKEIIQNGSGVFGGAGKPAISIIFFLGCLIFGFSEFGFFFTSLIFNLASICLLYKICLHLFDQKMACLSSFLFAISGIMIYFSRTSMPQAIMIFFCLLAYYAYLKIDENKWSYVFGAASVGAFFSHPSTGLVIFILWILTAISVIKFHKNLKRLIVLRIILTSLIFSIILFLIAELPYILFGSVINQKHSYFPEVLSRGVRQGKAYGIFNFHEIQFFFKNLWTSEFIAVVFIIIGMIFIIIQKRELKYLSLIILPSLFIFLYFSMGIRYRFRIFILIYPFLFIMGGLGIVNTYRYLTSIKILLFRHISYLFVSIIFFSMLIYSINLSFNFQSYNKGNFETLCSRLDTYLSDFSKGELRRITDDQIQMDPIFKFYLSKKRIEHRYPHLAKSLIWDWSRSNFSKNDYGDIIILIEKTKDDDNQFSDEISSLIEGRVPIFTVPLTIINRTSYLQTTFKMKKTFIKVYDLRIN